SISACAASRSAFSTWATSGWSWTRRSTTCSSRTGRHRADVTGINLSAANNPLPGGRNSMFDTVWPQPESLVLYQDLFTAGPGAAMAAFLQALPQGGGVARRAYLDLVRALYLAEDVPGPAGDAWQDYVIHRVLSADNAFTRAASAGS